MLKSWVCVVLQELREQDELVWKAGHVGAGFQASLRCDGLGMFIESRRRSVCLIWRIQIPSVVVLQSSTGTRRVTRLYATKLNHVTPLRDY